MFRSEPRLSTRYWMLPLSADIFAFSKVETSLQYLVRNWSLIVEFISVWKRLSEFEKKLHSTETDSSAKI